MIGEAEIPRFADLVLLVEDNKVRLFRPAVIDASGVEALIAPLPARLLLALTLHQKQALAPSTVQEELWRWMAEVPHLGAAWRETLARMPGGVHGSLLYVLIHKSLVEQELASWWVVLRERPQPVPTWALQSKSLPRYRDLLRLQLGWRRSAALALAVGLLGQLIATTAPGRSADDMVYALSHMLMVPRPAQTPDLEVLLLPRVEGENLRTDRNLLATVLDVAFAQGAAVVGLDAMLDMPGSAEGAASLAAALARHRESVVAVEFPQRATSPGVADTLIAPIFQEALCPLAEQPCAARVPHRAPVAFGGVFDQNPGRFLHSTRLVYDESEYGPQVPAVPGHSSQDRWGTMQLPVLGVEVYRRWCAGLAVQGDACWDLLDRWDGHVRLRYPNLRTPLLTLDKDDTQPEQIAARLASLNVDLRGKALLVSSWDPAEDARYVPVTDQLSPEGRKATWPGVMVQAALFHTLAERDPLWALSDRVNLALGAGRNGRAGPLTQTLWLFAWALASTFAVLLRLPAWVLLGLLGLLMALSLGALVGGSLWLPVFPTGFCVLFSWLLFTLSRR